jgi:hypothetical protein
MSRWARPRRGARLAKTGATIHCRPMFPPRRTSGIPTRSLSRAFVAVLALLLSSLGGIRFAFDRLGGAEEETVLVAAVAASSRLADCSSDLAPAQPAACPSARATASGWAPVAGALLPHAGSWPAAPTMRQGSAGGPRAP